MSLVIRLKRLGTKKKPHSRIIVCEKKAGRDSREIDKLGYYDPSKNPPFISFDKTKAEKWLSVGAQPSATIKAVLKKQGII
ncbi:MAG: 30S ribosomal protein S16 [Candidatus Omnitrophota bacterium]